MRGPTKRTLLPGGPKDLMKSGESTNKITPLEIQPAERMIEESPPSTEASSGSSLEPSEPSLLALLMERSGMGGKTGSVSQKALNDIVMRWYGTLLPNQKKLLSIMIQESITKATSAGIV